MANLLSVVADAIAAKITADPDMYMPPEETITRLLILRDNVDEQLAHYGATPDNGHPTTNGHTQPKPWLCGAPTVSGNSCRCHVLVPGTRCRTHTPGALIRCGAETAAGDCRCVVTTPGDRCQHHTPGRAKVVRE